MLTITTISNYDIATSTEHQYSISKRKGRKGRKEGKERKKGRREGRREGRKERKGLSNNILRHRCLEV